MSKINYVCREDGQSNLISAESEWDFLDLEEILEDFPYILKAMEEDGYYIENDICTFFDEIVFENNVVGFATFETRNDAYLMLTECFIMPEFRGKRLFFDEICKMIFVGTNFGILQPTRNVVDLLLDYAFAKNVTENIVVSGIPFYFDDFDAKSTKDKQLDEDEMNPSHFYDLSINSTIYVDGDEVIYHQLLENDLRKHGSRVELSDDYFNNLIRFFGENEFEELIEELKGELPKVEFGFKEVVGHGMGLSDFMQGMVNDDLMSFDEAMKIKEQLTREYEMGEINDDNVADRLISLITTDYSPFGNFSEFKELLNSEDDIEDEDFYAIKDFVNIIGDNEELGNGILEAMINDDEESFERLIMDAMANDEDFLDNFLNFANGYSEDEIEFPDGGFLSDLLDETDVLKYKLDDTEYGSEYPISYDVDIYKVLQLLQIGLDFNIAINVIEFEVSPNPEILFDILVHSGFIQESQYEIDWMNSASEFNKSELKDILRENNLKVSGNKGELLKRLADNNVSFGETFKITPKGQNYLKEFLWINYYERFLYDFDFNDFYKYKDNHEGDLKEVSLSYLDEHIKLARENDDKDYLEDCLFAKKAILDDADQFMSDLNTLE